MITDAEAPQAGAAPAWLVWYRKTSRHPWRRVTSWPDEAAARQLATDITAAVMVNGDWYVGPATRDPNEAPRW